ncbi:uncharacterized protein LOC118736356 [Rhagoletis pomonella]|uniref:uncharacterized protein LOC118736356 n=1 Tax=Rhagoletis pomonella TaxID=28610 RepID=UPI00177A7D30|nr:uncharacterized protein LOC118736356 [Rhagoletis pomonella]
MSSGVLALIVVSVILISSANSENAYTYVDQEQLNDTSFLSWKDLRNEVRQGDAVTYELGTPQYQILNADEPIEIITADQPGYYESLRRYEQAAKKPKTQQEQSTTQTPKKAELQQMTEQTEAPVSSDDKKIKFVIFQSKDKSKGSKKLVGMRKSKIQQDAMLAESRDNDHQLKPKKCKHNKLPERAESSKLSTFSSQIDRSTLEDQSNMNSASSVITDSRHQHDKEIQTIFQHFATTPQPLQPLRMSEHIYTTQSTIVTQNSHAATSALDQSNNEPITAGSIQYAPLSAIPTPVETLPDSSPMFLLDGTRVSHISSSHRNSNPERLYEAKVNAKYPYYAAPPHIRDFEYLYRSALAMNEQ